MIPQKMSSQTELEFEGINLLTVSDIQVILKQDNFYMEIDNPTVISPEKLIFRLTAEEAAELNYKKPVSIQVLYLDAQGEANFTQVTMATVDQVIKEGIYGN